MQQYKFMLNEMWIIFHSFFCRGWWLIKCCAGKLQPAASPLTQPFIVSILVECVVEVVDMSSAKKLCLCNITIDEGWILFISISCLLHTVQSGSGLKEEKRMWLVREWRENFYIIQNALHIQHESFQLSPNRIKTEIWSREMKNEILMAFFCATALCVREEVVGRCLNA